MLCLVFVLDRENDLDFVLVRLKYPILLVLSVRDFARSKLFASKCLVHGFPDWCTDKVSLELGELLSNAIYLICSLCSYRLVFCSNFCCSLLVVRLFDFLGLCEIGGIDG